MPKQNEMCWTFLGWLGILRSGPPLTRSFLHSSGRSQLIPSFSQDWSCRNSMRYHWLLLWLSMCLAYIAYLDSMQGCSQTFSRGRICFSLKWTFNGTVLSTCTMNVLTMPAPIDIFQEIIEWFSIISFIHCQSISQACCTRKQILPVPYTSMLIEKSILSPSSISDGIRFDLILNGNVKSVFFIKYTHDEEALLLIKRLMTSCGYLKSSPV